MPKRRVAHKKIRKREGWIHPVARGKCWVGNTMESRRFGLCRLISPFSAPSSLLSFNIIGFPGTRSALLLSLSFSSLFTSLLFLYPICFRFSSHFWTLFHSNDKTEPSSFSDSPSRLFLLRCEQTYTNRKHIIICTRLLARIRTRSQLIHYVIFHCHLLNNIILQIKFPSSNVFPIRVTSLLE